MKKATFGSFGQLWCRAMHRDVTWPVQGHYRCRACNRLYEVPWEDCAPRAAAPPATRAAVPAKPISIAA